MRIFALFALFFTGVLTIIVLFVDPHTTALLPGCVFRTLTGWACPLCGGMRAVHSLVHGGLARAVSENLLILLTVPLSAGVLAADYRLRKRSNAEILRKAARIFFIAFAGLAVLFTALRNIPCEPFNRFLP
ncbi:MAG: DUF2752 domain-containing protein [Brevinematales bacterium]|nr:DUF2752 domain-containing protein [Brevinematales bacterium]